MGQELQVEGHFFLFNCPNVKLNETIRFQLVTTEDQELKK